MMGRSDPPVRVLALVIAISAVAFALVSGLRHTETSDLASFAQSRTAWVAHGTPYAGGRIDRPNLNPPFAVLTIFAPLPWVPLRVAYVGWTLAGLACVGWTLWRVQRRLALSWLTVFWASVACAVTVPAMWAWMEGQVTWLMLPVLTEAWLAHREGHRWRAGAWLAPAIALKPSLALLAILLPWPIWIVAGVGSALLTLASVAIVGAKNFTAWLSLSGQITWLTDPLNGSLWGLAARLGGWTLGATSMADLPRAMTVWTAVVCVALAAPVLRADTDRRWLLGMFWMSLVSPLGWIYYLPWILGPLVALRPVPPSSWSRSARWRSRGRCTPCWLGQH